MEQKDTYQLLNRLDDYIDKASNKYMVSATRFLNPYEQSLCISKLTAQKDISYNIFGGYENSERNMIIIHPIDMPIDLYEYLSAVKIEFSKYDTKYLNHRAILGSVLSLGISRDGIGDIIINSKNNSAYLIAAKKMAIYINNNLLQVARAHITTSHLENISQVNLDINESKIITGTVASLRIDCILSLALKTSRNKACDLIKEQLIYINWQLVNKPTAIVKESDKITIRKKGRVVVKQIGNTSKKNRIWVELEVFV